MQLSAATLTTLLLVLVAACLVSAFQIVPRILPTSRDQLLRGQLAYLKGTTTVAAAGEESSNYNSLSPFEASMIAKRLRGEPIRFGKRSPREPIRFGKRFNPLPDYDFQ